MPVNATVSVADLLVMASSNPKVAVAVAVQVVMGFALGYYMAKIAKYLLALIAVLAIGAILNVWSLGGSVEDFLSRVGAEAMKLKEPIMNLITVLGILTVGPLALGFLLGLALGLTRK